MFELVGDRNIIVVKYAKTDLILLRLRNNNTGTYIDLDEFQEDTGLLEGLTICSREDIKTLDELITKSKEVEDKEGWIVAFDDDTLLKVKTDWYNKQDKTTKSLLLRENNLIALILNEKIDDAISKLQKGVDDDILENIDYITDILCRYIGRAMDALKKADKYYQNLKGGKGSDVVKRKTMYLQYKDSEFFSLIMQSLKGGDNYETLKEYILKKTGNLEDAKKFLKDNE